MNIWVDGSTTRVCLYIEGQEPEVIMLPKKVTTNQGEYWAAICALVEACSQGVEDVIILSDSELLVRQMQAQYKTKNSELQRLRAVILDLGMNFNSVRFEWIPREKNPAGLRLELKS